MPRRWLSVLLLACAVCLLIAAPPPTAALRPVSAATDVADPFAPLVALAVLLAWLLIGWLLMVSAVTSATSLPGRVGMSAGRLARRIAPLAVRRLMALALGVSLAAGASPAAADDGRAAPKAPSARVSTLDWPTAAAGPALTRPTPPAGSTLDWPTASASLDLAPGAAVDVPIGTPARSLTDVAAVVVRPGDSLWRVADRALGADATDAQVARSWPTWWAANRDAVGADPALIHPGLRLDPPVSR